MNEKTGEYAFYNVSVDVEEPEDPIQTIELLANVRESVQHIVNIENPTDLEVTIPASEVTCDNEDIEILPNSLVIPPRAERGFEINYRPLVASEDVTTDLIIQNGVLGQFKFRLVLRG
jgi:P pilus assembly chaperone PapD